VEVGTNDLKKLIGGEFDLRKIRLLDGTRVLRVHHMGGSRRVQLLEMPSGFSFEDGIVTWRKIYYSAYRFAWK